MIPYLLAALGGYLIGDSIGEDIDKKIPEFAEGGVMAKGGKIKVGDKVRSIMPNYNFEGEVLSTNGDMVFVRMYNALPNGDMQHQTFRLNEVEKMADGGVMAKGGKIDVWATNNVDLIRQSMAEGSKKVRVEFYPAYDEKEHSNLSSKLKDTLKKSKVSIFDVEEEAFEIIDLVKNPKDVKSITWVKGKIDGGVMAKGGQVSGYFKFSPYKTDGDFYMSTTLKGVSPDNVMIKGVEGKLKGDDIRSAEYIASVILQEHPEIDKVDIIKQGASVLKNKKVASFIRDYEDNDRYHIQYYADGGEVMASGGTIKSKKVLFKDLEEIDAVKFKGVGIKSKGIDNETYGGESYIYIDCDTPAERKRIQSALIKKGYKVNTDYNREGSTIEVRVSYFKGRNWNE